MALLTSLSSSFLHRPGIGRWILRGIMAWLAWPLLAHAAPSREYQVKAVFLFNFAQFVEWPPAAFKNVQDPIVIGVLGTDPFGALLEDAVKGETTQGRKIVVRHFKDPHEALSAHILFITAKEQARLRDILGVIDSHPILTVGESEGFALNGGVIRFIVDRGKIRLRVNVEAARRANLKLSSKLLRPAEIVGGGAES